MGSPNELLLLAPDIEAWLWRHPDYESDSIDEYTRARRLGLRPLDDLATELKKDGDDPQPS